MLIISKKIKKGFKLKLISLFFTIFIFTTYLSAEKIKNIANIVGVRDNQLIGYGLVVGLRGTGDGSSSKFTLRALSNLLSTVNVKIDPQNIKSKNVAAVIVTAKLPPFARQGDKIDVIVSSIGDAKSLEGGTLLLTPLKGVDGKIYALAQGALTIGGRNGRGGSLNHPTVATIFEGAVIEREVLANIYKRNYAKLSLKRSDFENAVAVQDAINDYFHEIVAVATDARGVELKRPKNLSMVEFLAKVEEIDINYKKERKIVIDERTATVVAGINIKIDPVVITHGDLTIKISPQNNLKIDKQRVDMQEGVAISPASNIVDMQKDKVTVANLARVLHKLGATPKDIISILEAMKKAGAINAKLEII